MGFLRADRRRLTTEQVAHKGGSRTDAADDEQGASLLGLEGRHDQDLSDACRREFSAALKGFEWRLQGRAIAPAQRCVSAIAPAIAS
jgi:hypothetical protein